MRAKALRQAQGDKTLKVIVLKAFVRLSLAKPCKTFSNHHTFDTTTKYYKVYVGLPMAAPFAKII